MIERKKIYTKFNGNRELARRVIDIIMARAKVIYMLIIEVNKSFYFFFVVEFYFTRMTDTGSRNHEFVKICGKAGVEAILAVKEMEKLSNCLRNRDSAVLKAHQ